MAVRKIYTDLDSLFDTEVVFLDLLDARLVKEYYTNEVDIENSYLYLNRIDFMTLFKDRDKRILSAAKNSTGTDLIRNIIKDMDIANAEAKSGVADIVLYINTYPYKLDDDEMKSMQEFYSKYMLFANEVHVIYKEDLSASFVNNLVVMVSRYGLDWFMNKKISNPAFRCPHLRLIIPDRIYNDTYIREHKIDTDKLLETLSTMLMSDVRLEFVENEIFMLKIDSEE